MAKRGKWLVVKVMVIGLLIATLSYLFHPDIAQFSLTMNGAPLAESTARFAALPTFLVILVLAAVMTLLFFLEIGFFILFGSFLLGFIVLAILAPYLWPVLVIIFLIIAIMS